jgi:hypothetical protein
MIRQVGRLFRSFQTIQRSGNVVYGLVVFDLRLIIQATADVYPKVGQSLLYQASAVY